MPHCLYTSKHFEDDRHLNPDFLENEQDLLRNHYDSKSDLSRVKREGGTTWKEKRDMRKEDDKKKQEELAESLQEFQDKTGINEQKYIEQVTKCKDGREIDELEGKFKKAATKWYELQMQKSGVFEPIADPEAMLMKTEMDGLINWFSKLPFYGDVSMVSTLNELEKNLAPKREFRHKLKKQSSLIKDEFVRRLGSLALTGSREQLLDNILKEIKEVENSPSAVQAEFKKLQKSTKSKDTAALKSKTLAEWNLIHGDYKKMLMANLKYFGGEESETKWGDMPETAAEFMEWFEDLKSFNEMKTARKKLPKLIAERKKLCEKRDSILEHALPEERKKFMAQTQKMRRHELESYLPELEKHVREKNIHVAEFIGMITVARTYHVDLFQPFETVLEIRKFRLANFETQQAKLVVLKQEIKDRDKTVREYFALPTYLRDDTAFLSANAFDREKMVMDAKERLAREQKEPFDMGTVDHLDKDELQNVEDKLDSDKGEKVMDDLMKEMTQEGDLATTEIQEKTYKRIFGTQKYAKDHEMTQKERYLDDLKYWVRLDRNVKTENDVTTERERAKWRYIEAANEGYDLGYVVTSGGEVRDLQKIKKTELEHGNTKVYEKLSFAKYSEHVMIEDEDGYDADDPLKMIEKLSMQELMKVMIAAITKLGRGKMHLSDSNVAILRNSPNIRRELASKIIEREFTHLQMDSANNTDSFLTEAAA
jgi:hypothetical protein